MGLGARVSIQVVSTTSPCIVLPPAFPAARPGLSSGLRDLRSSVCIAYSLALTPAGSIVKVSKNRLSASATSSGFSCTICLVSPRFFSNSCLPGCGTDQMASIHESLIRRDGWSPDHLARDLLAHRSRSVSSHQKATWHSELRQGIPPLCESRGLREHSRFGPTWRC